MKKSTLSWKASSELPHDPEHVVQHEQPMIIEVRLGERALTITNQDPLFFKLWALLEESEQADAEFYRSSVLAAKECAERWLFNAESIINMKSLSRRNLLRQCARELLEAIGATRTEK